MSYTRILNSVGLIYSKPEQKSCIVWLNMTMVFSSISSEKHRQNQDNESMIIGFDSLAFPSKQVVKMRPQSLNPSEWLSLMCVCVICLTPLHPSLPSPQNIK